MIHIKVVASRLPTGIAYGERHAPVFLTFQALPSFASVMSVFCLTPPGGPTCLDRDFVVGRSAQNLAVRGAIAWPALHRRHQPAIDLSASSRVTLCPELRLAIDLFLHPCQLPCSLKNFRWRILQIQHGRKGFARLGEPCLS
jgi:hypothetical protein